MEKKDYLLEEYKETQRKIELWTRAILVWGQVYLPAMGVIFFIYITQLPYFIDLGFGFPYLLSGWGLVFIYLLKWRLTTSGLDRENVATFPRLLKIEEELGGWELHLSYFFRTLSNQAKEKLSNKINKSLPELEKMDYIEFAKFAKNLKKTPQTLLLSIWNEFTFDSIRGRCYNFRLNFIFMYIAMGSSFLGIILGWRLGFW